MASQCAIQSWLGRLSVMFGLGVASLLPGTEALAAEEIVLRYNILERSISVEELTTFAETGEASSRLENYFELSGQKPERIQRLLTRQTDVQVTTLDRILNTPMGDVMLDQMGDFVHTPSDAANRQAMRSALVLSASDDNQISLLEIIQNYPTEQVHVNGNRFATAYRQMQNFEDRITEVLEEIGLPNWF